MTLRHIGSFVMKALHFKSRRHQSHRDDVSSAEFRDHHGNKNTDRYSEGANCTEKVSWSEHTESVSHGATSVSCAETETFAEYDSHEIVSPTSPGISDSVWTEDHSESTIQAQELDIINETHDVDQPHLDPEGFSEGRRESQSGHPGAALSPTEELQGIMGYADSPESPWDETASEIWVVAEDFAASSSQELSVTKGQQVELLEAAPSGNTDWCLVKLVSNDAGVEQTQGLVPMAVLKQVPNLRVSQILPGRTLDNEDSNSGEGSPHTSSYSVNSAGSNSSAPTSSPANKRRGSSFRKWLTTPVRKKSQTRIEKSVVEKTGSAPTDMHKAKDEKKAAKFPSFKERSESSGAQGSVTMATTVTKQPEAVPPTVNGEELEEAAPDIELPPPMPKLSQPLAGAITGSQEDVHSKASSTHSLNKGQDDRGTNPVDLAQEMENIVKQRLQTDQEKDGTTLDQNSHLDESAPSGGENQVDGPPGGDEPQQVLSEEEEYREKQLKKRRFVIQELVETEKDYVHDLGLIVEGYMEAMKEGPLPEDMQGKDKIVFGNVHQIYDWHRETFMQEILKCLDEPQRLGGIFVRYERRLYMYVKYCENKPKSEYIVAEYIDSYFEELRQKLGHRLTLPDLLIKPVQRIMKYQLLLKDILKCTERSGEDTRELKKAVHVMNVVPNAANDMMSVGRLQGFDGKITAQGKLLLQGTLLVMEQGTRVKPDQQKFRERRIFLFEQIIIFSEESEKRKNNMSNPRFVFKASVQVNKMSMNEKGNGDPLTFTLIDKTPGSDMKYTVQVSSDETKTKWVNKIRSLLDMQGDFLRALQSPIAYQKELTKEL